MNLRDTLFISLWVVLLSPPVFAGGFESGENTAIANGRGGTGVVSRTDAAAIMFNPSLLVEARGVHLTADANFLNEELEFQRDTFEGSSVESFDLVKNERGFFPIPFFAISTDFFSDWIAAGFAVYGPHSYGKPCLTEIVDGECIVEPENGARHMLIASDLIEIFSMFAMSIALNAGEGDLLLGLAGGFAFQQIDIDLVVDQVIPPLGDPYTENTNFQGTFRARDMTDLRPAFNFGLTYILGNLRLGFSARPGLNWKSSGQFDIDLPEAVVELVEFSSDELELEVKQAGSYRFGVGWFGGSHPYYFDRSRWDVELNVVFEDWSRSEAFVATPNADLVFAGAALPLGPVVQPKGYQDTFSLRLGGSYAATNFLTLNAGGFLESAAQRNALTNADFVSWERLSLGAGVSYDVTDFLKLTASYSHIFSPDRTVTNGGVFQSLPLSQCTGPDYTESACRRPGIPNGNPQNNGTWSSSFQIIGVGLSVNLQ